MPGAKQQEEKVESRPGNYDVSEKDVVDKADFPTSVTKHPELAAEDVLDKNHPFYGELDEHMRPIPGWREQITIRALVLSAGLGVVFNLMVLKLGLTVGIIPSLNIAAGLIGFAGIKTWVMFTTFVVRALGDRTGFRWLRWLRLDKPFTRQENCVIQTTVVAIFGLTYAGGYYGPLLSLDWNSYLATGGGEEGGVYPNGVPANAYSRNMPSEINGLPVHLKGVIQPKLGLMMAFAALIYFLGVFVLVPFRKIFILKYRLTYPSGKATGTIINSFHTPSGEAKAKKQLKVLGKWYGLSFLYSALKWCFSGPDEKCGLTELPLLGMKAKAWNWYVDFDQTYIAIGLMVPKHISYGITLGAAIMWGIMWPFINNHKKGLWFSERYAHPSMDIRGIYGYMTFVTLGLFLGDGAYNITKLFALMIVGWCKRRNERNEEMLSTDAFARMTDEEKYQAKLEGLRDHIFVKGQLSTWLAILIYCGLAGLCSGVLPQLYPDTKWYYVILAYVVAPALSFCNAYGMGPSDWNLAAIYAKLCIFIFAAWQGPSGGVVAGLTVGVCMISVISQNCDLMGDFRTAHLTLASPRSMVIAQLIGSAMSIVIAPSVFWLYWTGFNLGDPNSQYQAPYAALYRGLATVAANGAKGLPKHWQHFFMGALALAIFLDILRDALSRLINPTSKYVKLVPIPSMLAITGIVGGYFTIDMTIGAVILCLWQYFAPTSALEYASVAASGLIAGSGTWSVPDAIIQIAGASPPFCAQFWTSDSYLKRNIGNFMEGQPAPKSALAALPAPAPAPFSALAPL